MRAKGNTVKAVREGSIIFLFDLKTERVPNVIERPSVSGVSINMGL